MFSLVASSGSTSLSVSLWQWRNRDIRIRYIHKHARAHTHTHTGSNCFVYDIQTSEESLKTPHIRKLCMRDGFINLPFRLSLLAALNALNACMKMIIISILNLIRPTILNSSHSRPRTPFANRQFHPLPSCNHQFELYNQCLQTQIDRTNDVRLTQSHTNRGMQ